MTRDKRIVAIRFSVDEQGLALELTAEVGTEIVHERYWLGTSCTPELLEGLETALARIRRPPAPIAA